MCQSRRYHLAKIAVYPLEYQTDGGTLRLARQANIHLSLRDRTPDELRARLAFARPSSADDPFRNTRRWIASVVVNSTDLDRLYPVFSDAPREEGQDDTGKSGAGPGYISEWPSTEGQDVPYVIVTNNTDEFGNNIGDMASAFQVHADAFTQLGVPAVVRTVSEIEEQYPGVDRPARIRAFIQEAVAQWGTSYVLLGGDLQVVPSRRVGGPDCAQLTWRLDDPIDYWYTRVGVDEAGHAIDESWNLDEDAWFGERQSDIQSAPGYGYVSTIWLGRLPARTSAEAATMIHKTHRYLLLPGYEQWAAPADFYQTVTTAAGPVFSLDSTNVEQNGIRQAEYVAVEPLTYSGSPYVAHFKRLYPNVGGCTDRCDTLSSDLAPCFPALADYVNARVGVPPDYWTGDDLRDALNAGTHLLYHVEHSLRDFLGKPTAVHDPAALNPDCTAMEPEECYAQLDAVCNPIQKLELSQVLALQNAPDNSPARYSIVLSKGCSTNMIDMNAIGEAFLRAPDGGAVAYLGASGPIGAGSAMGGFQGLVRNLLSTECEPYQWCPAWYDAMSAAALDDWTETKCLATCAQLGIPALWVWRGTPTGFSLSTSTVLAGLNNLITVTVHAAGTLAFPRFAGHLKDVG